MAITKNFLKTRPACKVKFKVGPEGLDGAEAVFLVGDFNNWDKEEHPMKAARDGSFSTEMELNLGGDYQFRYVTDTGVWINDPEADAYVPCAYSGEKNSLLKV